MEASTPQDPMPGLADAAVTLHELFVQYQDAGFTEAQAFDLVKTALLAGLRGGSA